MKNQAAQQVKNVNAISRGSRGQLMKPATGWQEKNKGWKQKNEQQAGGNKPCGIRKAMRSNCRSIHAQGDRAGSAGCFIPCRVASKIKRVRLNASERVSLMSMDFAVLLNPKAGERLSCLRAWVALRLSAYDCLPMRNFQVSEPTCMSRASRMEPSGSVSAVLKENPRRGA